MQGGACPLDEVKGHVTQEGSLGEAEREKQTEGGDERQGEEKAHVCVHTYVCACVCMYSGRNRQGPKVQAAPPLAAQPLDACPWLGLLTQPLEHKARALPASCSPTVCSLHLTL